MQPGEVTGYTVMPRLLRVPPDLQVRMERLEDDRDAQIVHKGGKWRVWVPDGDGGAMVSGTDLAAVLDEAEGLAPGG